MNPLWTPLPEMIQNSDTAPCIRARPRDQCAHARAGRAVRAARAAARETMVFYRLTVLILLVCAVVDGRVSSIVCGDCDVAPGGCSPGCPVERVVERVAEQEEARATASSCRSMQLNVV